MFNMPNKQKLELTWIGKDKEEIIEPRILIEDPEKGYGDKSSGNMLIHGDNLLALKALEADYAGRIKCIYIDPPYNINVANPYYKDDLPHSDWLSLMYKRLTILRNLLLPNGFFCCHIDDTEGHYLKVLLDEIFGRNNYLNTLYIRVRYPDKTLKSDMDFHKEIEQVHVYRKEYGANPNLIIQENGFEKFCYYVNEIGHGELTEIGGKKVEIIKQENYEIVKKEGSLKGLKEIWATGTILDGNSSGRYFRDYLTGRNINDGYGVIYKVYGIGNDQFDFRYFTGPKRVGATKGKYYQGIPIDKLNEDGVKRTLPINNFYDFAGNFGNCRQEGGVEFRAGKKPEILLNTIINYFSDEGDIVLDSFLGSGTTAAVAHKMNRKWIGIELGDHCYTHCIPRLKVVVDGEQGGISKAVNWKGGGGFKFYELAPSLLKKDKYGNWVISEKYNPEKLATAMAKHEGFKYCPDTEIYWKQGYSTEKSYIFTTTAHVTAEYIEAIYNELKRDEALLICASTFDSYTNCYKNINIKKIPQILFDRCEFGKDNYNLNIIDVPKMEEDE